MSRDYCQRCLYPITNCVCAAVTHVALPIRVIILQHTKEINHAKNTARLAKLISPSIELVHLHDREHLNAVIKSLVHEDVFVLYPGAESVCLENCVIQRNAKHVDEQSHTQKVLVLIDSSWRQAHGVWKQNQWLQAFTHCHISNFRPKQYIIRKSKKPHQLSTIEALAYSVEILGGVSGKAYIDLFMHKQQQWRAYTTSNNKS